MHKIHIQFAFLINEVFFNMRKKLDGAVNINWLSLFFTT